jgi:hypothetical protein
MSQQELHEINKYCSPASLLVITKKGELFRLYCPFQAIVIHPIASLEVGKIVFVTQVKIDVKLLLVYVVENKGYYYYNFSICIH